MNLVFETTDVIRSPLTVDDDFVEIFVTNMESTTASNLGLFIRPTTRIETIDYPSEYPPETDYQDLLEHGSLVEAGLDTVGGMVVRVPVGSGEEEVRITRDAGASLATKIPMNDIAADETVSIFIKIEKPTSLPSRMYYVDVVIE